MKDSSIISHIKTSFEIPTGEIKVTNNDMTAIRAIADLTENWYPNEYHFISEELFKHLLTLSRLIVSNTH